MKIKKADEMEKHHNVLAARNGFVFYAATLLSWSIYDQIKTGNSGWQFSIMIGGVVVFFWTRVYFHRKTK